ncbi:MAG: arginase family protein, partial [Planctomycetota bacterium]
MSDYPSFLESEIKGHTPEDSFFHVIPVPFEKSVSYGQGTANGPAAILEASQQLETWDGFSCPCDEGIFTTEPVDCGGDAEAVIAHIKQAVQQVFAYGETFPFTLGGEHTVTNGAVQALHEAGEPFGIVQFDAHADLRDSYEGSKWSHACVMKRAVDLGVPVFQLGVR